MTALDVLPSERLVMIYNSIDFSRVPGNSETAEGFRRRYSIPAGRSLVVQVSWIIPEKGIVDLLETARLVLSRNRNVQFVLVGDGSHREEYTRLAAEMGLGEHVTWTGLVEDPFGEGVYAAADVVCQVSRWEELFGYVVAEVLRLIVHLDRQWPNGWRRQQPSRLVALPPGGPELEGPKVEYMTPS